MSVSRYPRYTFYYVYDTFHFSSPLDHALDHNIMIVLLISYSFSGVMQAG